jgi:SAM-dependent methyltransferase
MDELDWVPEGVDTETPSAARMYDYFLGGAHNFAADREMARKALLVRPDGALVAQANRSFLRRAVRFLVESGIRQFVDLGSGVPTVGNVHEVAQRYAPDARVVYVDIDPIAVTHARHLLAGNSSTVVLHEDVREPDEIFDNRRVRALLDFDRPIGVLAVAVLHFISDADDPAQLVRRIHQLVPAGSQLAIAHGTADAQPEMVKQMQQVYDRTANPFTARSHDEILRLFDGWQLVQPGLVWVPEWRPEDVDDDWSPELSSNYGGVAVKA